MKRSIKIAGIIIGGLTLIIIAVVTYINVAFPNVDSPKNITVEITPERLERGKYLANHVSVCMDCHSERDWSKFSGPIKPGTFGKGGDRFDHSMGFPGIVYAKNITPASLSNWSDGEILRAITMGVTKDNDPLFPIMPYYAYNNLTEEDAYSIIAYLKTLQPIESSFPSADLDFPLNFLVRTMPIKTYEPSKTVNKNNKLEYGKYLVSIAGCADCHTPTEKGEPIPNMELAGGNQYQLPGGILRAVNITPHETNGIGSWTEETFIQRFKMYDPDSSDYIATNMTDFNTIMPWTMYAGMTEEDLSAIYTYLMSVKPNANSVARWEPRK
jgi:mono/diheme cytochrome c family protein